MKKRIAITTIFACCVAGCLLPKVETFVYTDEGEACLVRADSQRTRDTQINSGDPLEVLVFFPHGCLSSSCSDVREARCEVAVEGDEIRVTSRGLVEEDVSPGVACTEDCGIMTARCDLAALPDGQYQLIHGDEVKAISLPGEPECIGGI